MKDTKRKFSICKSCGKCDCIDMVQCDDCDDWHHYRCVKVGSEIEDLDWSCMSCRKEFSVIDLGNLQILS